MSSTDGSSCLSSLIVAQGWSMPSAGSCTSSIKPEVSSLPTSLTNLLGDLVEDDVPAISMEAADSNNGGGDALVSFDSSMTAGSGFIAIEESTH
jgi:hypothetical protein